MPDDISTPAEGEKTMASAPTASSPKPLSGENRPSEGDDLGLLPATRRLAERQFTITAELQPPKELDDKTFHRQLRRYQRLCRKGWVDAITLPDFPRFSGHIDNLALLGDTPASVFTIASNARTRGTVVDRITRAVEGGARGLLVLSGGHPIRKIPGASVILPMNAFRTLSLAFQMREAGQLSPDLPIWAVENPFVGQVEARVDRLERKVNAKAEAILTQPPFLWERFVQWWNLAHERSLTQQVPIVVGVPVITSVKALRLWFLLVGISRRHPEARELLEQFKEAEAAGKDAFRKFRGNWTVELIGKIRELPGVAGIHLMPILGWRDLEKILEAAKLGPADRAQEDVAQLIPRLLELGVAVIQEPGLLDSGYVENFRDSLQVLKRVLEYPPLEWRPVQFRIYWNRITYKNHFRAPIAFRPFMKREGDEIIPTEEWELAIDLRQHASPAELEKALREALERVVRGETESAGGVVIGDYVSYSKSLAWQFNDAFWQHKTPFMNAHNRDYRDSIQGSPDTNETLIHYTAEKFLDQLKAIGDIEGEEYVYVEIGVASVDRARTFIEVLDELAHSQGNEDLLKSMKYVFADFSKSVLVEAEAELGQKWKGIKLEYILLHAEAPLQALSSYAGRILRVHETNVTDNVPTDKMSQIDERHHHIEARLYLPGDTLGDLAEKYDLDRGKLETDLYALTKHEAAVEEFLTHYQSDFRDKLGSEKGNYQFYHFWEELWNGFKLEERYIAIPALKDFRFIETVEIPDQGDILQEILGEYTHNVWMHLSNRAIEGGLQIIQLLHPQGVLEIIDLLVKEIAEYHHVPERVSSKTGRPLYRSGFKGPVKYDGSAVDWVNARLLRGMAERLSPNTVTTFTSLEQFDSAKAHMSIMELCPNPNKTDGPTSQE